MAELTVAAQLEALLFVAAGPLTVEQLATALDMAPEDAQAGLDQLEAQLAAASSGLRLSALQGSYRLTTAPAAATAVRRLLEIESKTELSRAALETLAIVAYRGPLTKAHIEQIRGVASDTMVRNLLARGLIMEAGKSPEPGHPQQYQVSHSFLQHFGLASLHELPPLTEADRAN